MGYVDGQCKKHGNFLIRAPPFDYDQDPCPKCGGYQTCDIGYSEGEPPFKEEEMNEIAQDYPTGSNVFPSDKPGPHNPVLIIFLNHPDATRDEILTYIRRRIRKHVRGEKTSKIHFHSQTEDCWGKLFPGKGKHYKHLVEQIRFLEPSFAEDGITFEDNYHRFNPNARKNASRNFSRYAGWPVTKTP